MSVPEDDAISDGWLCDRGRYNIGFYGSPDRLTQPLYRRDGECDADRLGRCDRPVGEGASARPSRRTARQRRRDRRRPLDSTKKRICCSTSFARSAVENLDWRTGRSAQAIAGRHVGGTLVRLRKRASDRRRRPAAGAERAGAGLRVRKAVARKGATLIPSATPPAPGVRNARSRPSPRGKAIRGRARRARVGRRRSPSGAATRKRDREPLRRDDAAPVSYPASRPNARGAEAMGMLPGAGGLDYAHDARSRRATGSSACSRCFGANPVLHWPDRALRSHDALRGDAVRRRQRTVHDRRRRASRRWCCRHGAFEKNGTTINVAGDVLPVMAGVAAPPRSSGPTSRCSSRSPKRSTSPCRRRPRSRPACANWSRERRADFGDARGSTRRRARWSATRPRASLVDATIFSGGGTLAHDERIGALRAPARATFAAARAAAQLGGERRRDRPGGPGNAVARRPDGRGRRTAPAGVVALVDGPPERAAQRAARSAQRVRRRQAPPAALAEARE